MPDDDRVRPTPKPEPTPEQRDTGFSHGGSKAFPPPTKDVDAPQPPPGPPADSED